MSSGRNPLLSEAVIPTLAERSEPAKLRMVVILF